MTPHTRARGARDYPDGLQRSLRYTRTMHFSHMHRRALAWLLLWTLALGALAPSAARLVVHADQRDAWVEVCASTGMVRLQLPADDAETGVSGIVDSDAGFADFDNHCPWCHLQGTVGVPVQVQAVALLPRHVGMPAAFYRPGPMPAVWARVHARAPPSQA